MRTIIKTGIYIGGLCALWQLIMAWTRWITNPQLMNLFYLVVLIEIGVLIRALKQSAGDRSYGQQVWAGTAMSIVAGVFLFLFSLFLTTLLFPNLMNEMKEVQGQMLRETGSTDAEISARLRLQTPLIQALMGVAGTLVTGIAASLVIASFAHRKRSGSD
jgi:hypothetical protein